MTHGRDLAAVTHRAAAAATQAHSEPVYSQSAFKSRLGSILYQGSSKETPAISSELQDISLSREWWCGFFGSVLLCRIS